MPGAANQQSVLNLLESLNDLDRLKELFWTELHYDRINEAVSRRGWNEPAAKALADDPVVLDVPRVLGAIKCGADEKTSQLPGDYNAALMKIKSQFAEEAKHRRSELEHTVSLTHGQRYVLRELGVLFRTAEDEELKAQINILEKAFRATRLSHAVKREINLCRRNAMTGADLVRELGRIYLQHNLREAIERQRLESDERPVPQIICSEALV